MTDITDKAGERRQRQHSIVARALRETLTSSENLWVLDGSRVNVADAIVYLANAVEKGLRDVAKAVRELAPAEWATQEEADATRWERD